MIFTKYIRYAQNKNTLKNQSVLQSIKDYFLGIFSI